MDLILRSYQFMRPRLTATLVVIFFFSFSAQANFTQAVLFNKESKAACTLDIRGRPELAPPFLPVADAHAKLPKIKNAPTECSAEDIEQVQLIANNSYEDSVQLAAIQIPFLLFICTTAAFSSFEYDTAESIAEGASEGMLLGVAGALALGRTVMAYTAVGAGVGAVCSGIGAGAKHLVLYYIREKLRGGEQNLPDSTSNIGSQN